MSAQAINWNGAIKHVAVFRALNLGDMLCSVPALRALRKNLPDAKITLIGLSSARTFLRYFSAYLDELVEFPGDPTFPEQVVRLDQVRKFYKAMRARRFDLILQMHGSGTRSNDIVKAMSPVQWAGFVPTHGHVEPGRLMLWPDHLHEVHRYLALLRHLGLEARDDALELPITAQDHQQADMLLAQYDLVPEQLIFIHPGARLASRRWPLDRYASVAQALVEQGWQVAVTGSDHEGALARALQKKGGSGVRDLCGMTTLGSLASLLQRGQLLICNDTGVSHVAACARVPSVVIASGSDVARWAPLDVKRHTVLHAMTPCRPCAYEICPIGHPCALGVQVEDVLRQVDSRLARGVAL